MKTQPLSRYALSSCVAAAMMAGCGGSQPIGALGASAQADRSEASKLTVLHRFTGYPRDGADPTGSPTWRRGELYGVTGGGGTKYEGTVYAVNTSGEERVVYNFNKKRDGVAPIAGLTLVHGELYGTTAFGGTKNRGTIYALTTSGTERVLYSFKGVNRTTDGSTTDGDGWQPDSTLVEVKHVLYGTTRIGGTPDSICGCGTVFSFNLATNHESVLYRFLGHSDGEDPSLLIAANGNLYGITASGGTNGCVEDQGCGTVFEISASGAKRTLYAFQGGTDGAEPTSLLALNGSFYGVTWEGGGTNCTNETQVVGCGTIFEIDRSGSEHIVYRFQGQPDAAFPNDLIDVNGTLYGASSGGGVHDHGTIFEGGATGQASVLYSFGAPHGKGPHDLLAVHGALYGAAGGGGVSDCFASSSFDPRPCGLVFGLQFRTPNSQSERRFP